MGAVCRQQETADWKAGMALHANVKEGQVYTDLPCNRPGARLWKVDGFCGEMMAVPHVRLIDVKDPTASKVISCRALKGRSYYQLVSEPKDKSA